jgi:hypothetical protein
MVKPATETRNTFFRPKRSTSQPFSGVAMAAATMKEVSTQVIWSCEADSAPCMCGRATLAMVPSSAWMMVASMIEIVIMVRLIGGAAPAPAAVAARSQLLLDAGAQHSSSSVAAASSVRVDAASRARTASPPCAPLVEGGAGGSVRWTSLTRRSVGSRARA